MKYLKYLVSYVLSFFYDIYYFLFGDIRSRVSGWDYYKASKFYPDYLKKGNMAEAVKWSALKYCQGKGVDVGAGRWPFNNAKAIEDNLDENAYKIKEIDNSLDFVFSSHNLEHLADWKVATREWYRVLKIGGNICLYLPHPVCAMWATGVNKQHLWSPNPLVVTNFLTAELKMTIKEFSGLPDGYLSFFIVAKK